LDWKRETPDYANYDFRDCASIPWRKNAVHAVNDVTKPIAWVQPCYGTFLNKVSVVINLAYPWHTDPNTLPAWNEIDLRGFATHEWGHSNGQMIGGDYSNAGHFWATSTILCDDPGGQNYLARESLCNDSFYGDITWRIPHTHETQLVLDAY
jgi:hypothetical protein